VVIRAGWCLQDGGRLVDEIATFRAACGLAHMKGFWDRGLGDPAKCGARQRGGDDGGRGFYQDFYGEEATNATLPVGLVMTRRFASMRWRRAWRWDLSRRVGFAPRSSHWSADVDERELGDSWLNAEMFRFGASTMLADIERQLEFTATGGYSAEYRHPMA